MGDFLNLLLPWQVSSSGNDEISDGFVYGILVLCGISLVIFLWKTVRRCILIKGLVRELQEFNRPVQPHIKQKLEEMFDHNADLTEAWQEFKDSLITRRRKENQEIVYKTDEASLFFSEERLLNQHLNLRFWNSVPALLVGLGILGTFVGLVWGLGPFSTINFAQTDAIQDAIKKLLSGISTAFVTSVWGMFTSLLFTVLEKWLIGWVSRAIANLQRALDRLFTLTTQEEIADRQEDELKRQTQALKSFSTDLANEIQKAMEPGRIEILQRLRKTPEDFSNAMAKKLEPSLSKLDAAVKELRLEKEKSSTKAIEQLVEQFQTSISGSAMAEIEALAKTVGKASKSLRTLPGQMKSILAGVQKQIDQSANRLEKVFQTGRQSVSTLLWQQGIQIQTVNDQIVNSQATLEKGREMLEEMGTSLTRVRQLIETTDVLSRRLMTGADQLKSAGKNLTQASDAFNKENKKYLSANRETITELQSALTQSQKLLDEFAQRFKTIDDGLKSIFTKIEEGLTTYSTTARESINTYLREFSEQLSSAATALAGSVEALKECVEQLTETLDHLQRRRGGR